MVEGPTDTTTVGLSLLLYHPRHYSLFSLSLKLSFSSKMEETTAAVVGFYPAFSSSFNLVPFLYFCPSFFISNNLVSIFTALFFSFLPLSPCPSQHARAQSALTALAFHCFPPHWLQSSLQQCHTRICSLKGRKRKACVTNDAASMHCIST